MSAWIEMASEHGGSHLSWKLDRPKPALPDSFFWTWDHSTNWVLDDPGLQVDGCYNSYLKRPGTFIEDYRRLTDMASGLGIPGIVIWGFLRDSHGGIASAKRVADHAAQRNVAILPGFGTTWYGGAYYEGDHPASLDTFLRNHPDAVMLARDGKPYEYHGIRGACPAHPAYQEWLQGAIAWLFREFEIGGLNIENGDFLEDFHPLTQAQRSSWPQDDPEPFFFQGLSYRQALMAVPVPLENALVAYATYTGFQYTDAGVSQDAGMGKSPPAMLRILPRQSVCQWTLSGMLLAKPLPLSAYLDDGVPAAAFDNPNWPSGLRLPEGGSRHVGFVHQGSQWRGSRYCCILSTIKEACLRSFRTGLSGVSIHGEVSSRLVPAALNYLAFSHFIHWPEDSLRDFGRKTLGAVLGSERDGEDFIEVMARCDSGDITDEVRKLADPASHGFGGVVCGYLGRDIIAFQRYGFWRWLSQAVAAGSVRDSGRLPV